MKTVLIHGQSHKGSTYNISRDIAEKIGGEIIEFFLPKDFGEFCCGCTNCIVKSEDKCPHYEKLKPITDAIDEADVIILASPVYVLHATGAMKAFLDHYGWRWMVHRPEQMMFKKQAVCVCTAAGGGMKSTNKDMAHSLFYWGVGRIYKYGVAVAATDWNGVSDEKKIEINSATTALADKIRNNQNSVTPSFKTKAMFHIMRMAQKKGWNEADIEYWKEKGWLEKKRPWKE